MVVEKNVKDSMDGKKCEGRSIVNGGREERIDGRNDSETTEVFQ